MSDPETLLEQAGRRARSGDPDNALRLLGTLLAAPGTGAGLGAGGSWATSRLGVSRVR